MLIAADTRARLGARQLDADRRVLVVRVELRDRHDAVVELDAEHGLRDGSDVAHGLLRRLALVGEHVDLDRAARPVADDPDGEDAAQAAELVFELSELGRGVSVPLGRQFVVRPLTRHGDPVNSPRARSPRPGTAYGHPTTQRGGRALPMLLVGLAWRSDPGETMRSFRPGGGSQRTVSGWRRQGLGLKSQRVT